jgi:D-arabinose 1-dehydrogenase-like Zn-dependent alcohol dehydrogenase
MLTEERMLVQLPSHLSSMGIEPMADAGLTAYNAVCKAAEQLTAGHLTLVLGAGGDRACGTLKKAGITAGRS